MRVLAGLLGGLWMSTVAAHAEAQPTPPMLSVRLPSRGASPGRLVAPLHGARTACDHPRFEWERLPEGSHWTLEVSRTRDFTGEVIRVAASGDGASLLTVLDPGRWYWRLDAGASVYVGPRMFVVRANGGSDRVSWGSEPDVDGDGESDLIFTATDARRGSGAGAIPVARLQGADAVFAARWFPPADERWFSVSTMGDADGDGATDLFGGVPTAHGASARFFSGRAPPFTERWGLETAPGVSVISVFPVGDLDRDGRGDLAGTLRYRDQVHPWAVTLAGHVVVMDPPIAPEGVQVVDAGDVDADGFADVAFVNRGVGGSMGCVRWVPGSLYGVDLTRARTRCQPAGSPWRYDGPIAAGDFDGDGDADLALTTSTPDGSRRVEVFAGGREVFAGAPLASFEAPDARGHFGSGLLLADADGDGRDDLWIGAPDGSHARGRVVVRAVDGRVLAEISGPDERAHFGESLLAAGVVSARGEVWAVTGSFPAPALNRYMTLLGGPSPTRRATLRMGRPRVAELRLAQGSGPPPHSVADEMDAVFSGRPDAFRAMLRRRPHLAVALATIAASEAGDAAAVASLDARQRALPDEGYLYLEVEGDGPLARAFDALRVGLISEVDDAQGLAPPLSVCRALLRHPAVALPRFDDRWGSGQSGPSEEVRYRCYAPLVRDAIEDARRADATLDAAEDLRFAHLRVAPMPDTFAAGTIVRGFALSSVDDIDGFLFGSTPDAAPTDARVASAERRLVRAVAATRAHLPGLDARVAAYRLGLEERVARAAEGSCALRRLRGLAADEDACRAWMGVAAREALARWLTSAWGSLAEGQVADALDEPVW